MLDRLTRRPGSRRPRKRVGRGIGSGKGRTCGRGQKGAGARAGAKRRARYEGGQMPLMLRIRKVGFRNIFRDPPQIVNVGDLARFGAGSVVDAQALGEAGLVRRADRPVKILGQGEIQTALMVRVTGVSASARQKLEAAGGTVEVLSTAPKGPKRNRGGTSQ